MDLYFGFGIVCNKSESLNVTSAVSCIESGENRILVLKETVRKIGVNEPIGVHTMNERMVGYMEEFIGHTGFHNYRPEWLVFKN